MKLNWKIVRGFMFIIVVLIILLLIRYSMYGKIESNAPSMPAPADPPAAPSMPAPPTDLPMPAPADPPDAPSIPVPAGPPDVPSGHVPNSVDKLLDKMEFWAIAFNAPSKININDSPQIHLLLSFTETVEKLKQSIAEEGDKIGASIRVSDIMEARLTGYMFQITAITREKQAVSKNQETEWKWEIHPKKEGTHSLHLTLTAMLKVDGHLALRGIRTFDKKIEVTVTNTQKCINFLKNNWQWLWAAILVPIVGWVWKRKKAVNKEN